MSENGQVQNPWTPPPAPHSRVLAALQRLASMQDWGQVPVALVAQATGYSERHVRRLLREMDIKRTRSDTFGHVRTRNGHETDTFGHERTRSDTLFPHGPGDEICSLVLSRPYYSPVLDPKILLDPKEEKDNPPPPSGETPPRAKALAGARGTRLPADPDSWALLKTALCTPSILKLGASLGFTLDDIQAICDDMQDWSVGKGETRKDWPATLRTFIKRAARTQALNPRSVSKTRGYTSDEIQQILAEDEASRRVTL